MEMISGWTHRAFPMEDATRVGEARRHAATLARELSMSELDAGRLALVVTELGTNLLRHALRGQLLVAARPDFGDVEVIAIDEGPGIADLPLAMRDGHSSGSTPGTGLGAIRRLADDFDIHSAVPAGTVCVARVRRAPGEARPPNGPGVVEVGAVAVPAPGEHVSGDAWRLAADGPRAVLALADGLGHGPEAHKAAQAAMNAFADRPQSRPREAVGRMHIALQTTRGAAVGVLAMEPGAGLTLAGAGNITGRVVSGVHDKALVTQHGTAGLRIGRTDDQPAELPPHALVVLHSDGIDTRWKAEQVVPLLRRDPSLVAAVLLRGHTRQRDDASIVVLRQREVPA